MSEKHAQGILWSLIFASKNIKQGKNVQADAARRVIEKIRDHSRVLVEEAELVSQELVSVSMLLIDIWNEAIDGTFIKMHRSGCTFNDTSS